jgi:hypothetical protein
MFASKTGYREQSTTAMRQWHRDICSVDVTQYLAGGKPNGTKTYLNHEVVAWNSQICGCFRSNCVTEVNAKASVAQEELYGKFGVPSEVTSAPSPAPPIVEQSPIALKVQQPLEQSVEALGEEYLHGSQQPELQSDSWGTPSSANPPASSPLPLAGLRQPMDLPPDNTLRQQVTRYMAAHELDLQSVALRAGVDPKTLLSWMSGKSQPPAVTSPIPPLPTPYAAQPSYGYAQQPKSPSSTIEQLLSRLQQQKQPNVQLVPGALPGISRPTKRQQPDEKSMVDQLAKALLQQVREPDSQQPQRAPLPTPQVEATGAYTLLSALLQRYKLAGSPSPTPLPVPTPADGLMMGGMHIGFPRVSTHIPTYPPTSQPTLQPTIIKAFSSVQDKIKAFVLR